MIKYIETGLTALFGIFGILLIAILFVLGYFWRGIRRTYNFCKEIFYTIVKNSVLTSFLLFLFVSGLIIYFTRHYFGYDVDFVKNIFVEAHGLIFDLLVIGIIALWLNTMGQKLMDIKRYNEEIDDFRYWRSEETTFRILGCIKRLNNNKVYKIDLRECCFKNAKINKVKIMKSKMSHSEFENCFISDVIFDEADLSNSCFKNVEIFNSSFSEIDVTGLIFENCKLNGVKFDNSRFQSTKFIDCVLDSCTFNGYKILGGIVSFENSKMNNIEMDYAFSQLVFYSNTQRTEFRYTGTKLGVGWE